MNELTALAEELGGRSSRLEYLLRWCSKQRNHSCKMCASRCVSAWKSLVEQMFTLKYIPNLHVTS